MSELLRFKIAFNIQHPSAERVKSLFAQMDMFPAATMKNLSGNPRRFNLKGFEKMIETTLSQHTFWTITIENERNTFCVFCMGIRCGVWGNLQPELFESNKERVMNWLDAFFQQNDGVVGYACSSSDNYWQNKQQLESFLRNGRSLEGLVIRDSLLFKNKKEVDIEYNPGHSHEVNELWFGSCWGMWFGEGYDRYIPLERLKSFSKGFSNTDLPDGSVRILLYEDVWEYEKTEHREIQWAFRREVGIDETAHYLMENPPQHDQPDEPAIEIFTENGKTTLVRHHYDSEGHVVPRSKAAHSHEMRFPTKGS